MINLDENLWKRWCSNADRTPDKDAIVHWVAGEEPCRWSFSKLISTAESISASLKENGIKPGDVCAIIIRHNPDFYPIYMAIENIKAIPAVLAYPNPRLHPDKFRQGIEGMSLRSGLDWILSERELAPVIKPLVEKKGSTIKGIFFPLEWDKNKPLSGKFKEDISTLHAGIKSTDPFLLQHSSGTTGLQKPVLLSHKAVLEHVTNYAEAINLSEQDKIVSWLPLYHDMGLIAAFHLPLAFGITSIQIDPFEWVLIPSLLFDAITKEKATITWLPNFAYNVLADKVRDDELNEISLETMRLFINCSEPIRHESHEKFFQKLKSYNLQKTALSTCYAMAETTYAVTQNAPGSEPSTLLVDRLELAKGKVKIITDPVRGRMCVSSGKVIKGCEVKIVDEKRIALPESFLGEIAIKSVSMFDGYRNYPEKTGEVLQDSWYFSGDLGFRYNDEYYVIGRKKDIIIVAGNNIYPEDIEDAVNKVDGIIPGRVIAFGEDDPEMGSELINVIAETNIIEEEVKNNLIMNIIRAGMSIDVTIKKVHLVPPRWLIKSSAGKPSRKANRERILANEEIIWS